MQYHLVPFSTDYTYQFSALFAFRLSSPCLASNVLSLFRSSFFARLKNPNYNARHLACVLLTSETEFSYTSHDSYSTNQQEHSANDCYNNDPCRYRFITDFSWLSDPCGQLIITHIRASFYTHTKVHLHATIAYGRQEFLNLDFQEFEV